MTDRQQAIVERDRLQIALNEARKRARTPAYVPPTPERRAFLKARRDARKANEAETMRLVSIERQRLDDERRRALLEAVTKSK